MKLSTFALIAVSSAQTTQKDPYQEIGREVGSIYQRIGSLISASSYDHSEVLSVHDAAQTAIQSLRHEISTIDWNALIGSSAAVVYTSQLEDYVKGLATVNEYLTSALTAPPSVASAQTTRVLESIASETASASSVGTQLAASTMASASSVRRIRSSQSSQTSSSGSLSASASQSSSESKSHSSKSAKSSSAARSEQQTSVGTKNAGFANAVQTGLMGAVALAALL